MSAISLQVSQLVEQGDEQKRLLTGFVREQLGTMNSEFGRREEAAQAREQSLIENITHQVDFLVKSAKEQNEAMAHFVDQKLGAVNQTFTAHQENAAEREKQRNQVFVEQTGAMKQGTEQLLERIDQGLQTQLNASNHLIEQGRALQSGIDSSVRASAEGYQQYESDSC